MNPQYVENICGQIVSEFVCQCNVSYGIYEWNFKSIQFSGTIEIVNDVNILKPGDKVGASEATLLNMLNISPFSYGLIVEQVS